MTQTSRPIQCAAPSVEVAAAVRALRDVLTIRRLQAREHGRERELDRQQAVEHDMTQIQNALRILGAADEENPDAG